MLKISIIQIGKTKEKWITEAESEYLKRLSINAQVKIQTLKPQTRFQSSAEVKSKEADLIIGAIPEKSFIIILDETGHQFTSLQFAQKIEQITTQGNSHLTFIIGGAFGLYQKVKQHADLILSFSKFTFTHEMIRPLLLEQIYRAFTIIQNKTYHY